MITRSIRFRMALWYAALLAGAPALFGAATYVGLERYLQNSLEESLVKQARSIGDVLILNINQSGEDYVENEITEHYSPEINGRFIRVTRADAKQIFVSGLPRDGTFDPNHVPAPKLPVAQAFTQDELKATAPLPSLHASSPRSAQCLCTGLPRSVHGSRRCAASARRWDC